MSNLLKYMFLTFFVVFIAGCSSENKSHNYESKPVLTKYYKGCKSIVNNIETENSIFVKTMINDNIILNVDALKSLGYSINNKPTYLDICKEIMRFQPNENTFSLINRIQHEYLLQSNYISEYDYRDRLNKTLNKK